MSTQNDAVKKDTIQLRGEQAGLQLWILAEQMGVPQSDAAERVRRRFFLGPDGIAAMWRVYDAIRAEHAETHLDSMAGAKARAA